jgi:hypothetical protein
MIAKGILVKYFSSSIWSFSLVSFSVFSSSDKELEYLVFSLLGKLQ